ncbi:hypothetical protein MMC13_005905 [Lambiella insularis]|nr:hypothetical protein [Lambiella insularis]
MSLPISSNPQSTTENPAPTSSQPNKTETTVSGAQLSTNSHSKSETKAENKKPIGNRAAMWDQSIEVDLAGDKKLL